MSPDDALPVMDLTAVDLPTTTICNVAVSMKTMVDEWKCETMVEPTIAALYLDDPLDKVKPFILGTVTGTIPSLTNVTTVMSSPQAPLLPAPNRSIVMPVIIQITETSADPINAHALTVLVLEVPLALLTKMSNVPHVMMDIILPELMLAKLRNVLV